MALTNPIAADIVQRALRAQGVNRELDDIRSDIRVALEDISRESMKAPYRAAFETVLSLTLGAADAQGVQTVSIGATVFEESIEIVDDVYHVAVSHKFVYKPDIGHLLALLSTSTTACYTRNGSTLSVRRPSAIVPVTASAFKVRGVLILTAIANLPVSLESAFIDKLIVMGQSAAK